MFRKLVVFLGCAAIVAFLLCRQTPIEAQGKKDDQAKQIQQLKKSLQEKENQINKLELQVQKQKLDYEYYKKKNPGAPKLQKDLDKANQTIKDKDAVIATLQKPTSQATKDLTIENEALRRKVRELEAFKTVALEADKTLAKISGVRAVWLGKPAEYGTPDFAQKGYQLGIVVLLDDADALQKFLDDPLHKKFNDKMGETWERPVIYDFQRDGEMAKKE
jgi:predicted RNase H-like nuclease (RuvC/YqgF family)